jgi:tetratricopeptide (TPR) repeat protein
MIGHWAHLGGMISGIVLASFLKLGEGAIEERHLEIGVKAAGAKTGYGEGEQSLRLVLQRNADNVEAMLMLARIKSKYAPTDEGRELYTKVIPLLIPSDPKEAVQAYQEYRKSYQINLEPSVMAALADIFQRQGDLDSATRCLDVVIAASDVTPAVRQKALAQCASMLDKLGFEEVAIGYLETLIKEFPYADITQRAYIRLGKAIPAPTSEPPRTVAVVSKGTTSTTADAVVCPACSSAMQKRRANNGAQVGKWFWVCAGYPQCKSLVPVIEEAS